MTITLGTWAIPAFLTGFCFACAYFGLPHKPGRKIDPVFLIFQLFVMFVPASVASSTAWLAWAYN